MIETAVTKIFAIRNRLDKRVSYATNEEKTSLDGMIDYAVNPDKTEKRLFESCLNCRSVETAFEDMMHIKKRYGKSGGVLGYHFIQSFKPGEVTPEQAHQYGLEFAKRLFGDRYQAVIGTHLDKQHLHNHVVINSVSFVDGKKYHSSPASYYKVVRATNDAICKENDLFIIEPKGRGKHYAQWKAEQEGRPTIRSEVKKDVDDFISRSLNFTTFIEGLRKAGYTVKYGNVKHTAVKPPGGKRFIRLDSLGADYTDERIQERIAHIKSWKRAPMPTSKHYYYRGNFQKRKKCTGLRAQYFHYVYLIRGASRRTTSKKVSRYLLPESIKFERYLKQHQFLIKNKIDTMAQLTERKTHTEAEIERIVTERKPLYDDRRNASTPEEAAVISAVIAEKNVTLKALRADLRLCSQMEVESGRLKERVREANEMEQQKGQRKSREKRKTFFAR